MNPHLRVFGVVSVILVSWLVVPPPTWAQSPDDTHMSSLNPDGCRSTDSDFPISYRGHADPQAPAFFWILPEDPFTTSCGYLDRDADGLLDWAEAELVWVFRPYFVFHEAESHAGSSYDPSLNGLQVFYQAHPIHHSMDGVTRANTLTKLIRVKLVIAFQQDSTHSGDTESVSYELMSRRESTTDPFTRWQLHAIRSQGCPDPSRCEPFPFETPNFVIATSLGGFHLVETGYAVAYIPVNMETHLQANGITEEGRSCEESPSRASNGTGICLPKVFISGNKHRPYLFPIICGACCHGPFHDRCGGGVEFPSCLGLPGVAFFSWYEYSGFQPFDDYLNLESIDSNRARSPRYEEMIGQYLGNIGEFHDDWLQGTSWGGVFLLSIFERPTLSKSAIHPALDLATFKCFGTEDTVRSFLADWESDYLLDHPNANLDGYLHQIPNHRFIHYSSRTFAPPPPFTCVEMNQQEIEGSFGFLSRQDCNFDPLAAQMDFSGVAGLYANYPALLADPAQREFLYDFWDSHFCGSMVPCELAADGKGADGFRSKFTSMTYPNQFRTCGSAFFWDTDQDGAPDDLDCEPRNPYLQWDLDRDGHCDLPVAQGDQPACREVCAALYFSMTHLSEAYVECVLRCQGPHDNCSPLVSRFGVPYYDQNEASLCRTLMVKFDGALLWRCQRWFENPDQADHNQNGVGDRCDRNISGVRVDIRADSFGTNRGYFAWCPDPTATVSAVLSNDREMGPSSKEMLSVGLCVCPGQTEASCRDDSAEELVLHCPSDSVADKINGDDYSTKDFAWDSSSRDFRYFYHPVAAASQRDLGTLTAHSKLDLEVHQGIEVPHQRLLARWRDAIFQGARVFLTFRTDQFREFPGFHPDTMLRTFPTETVVATHDRYSKLKFSSPQILEPEAVDNRSSEYRIPTHETWNPEAPTVEYDLLHVPPGMFSYDPEEDDLCVHFPLPVGQPVGYAEGSPLPVNPLWDPPRELNDPLFGWIPDEDGAWRLFGVDPASFQVRSYVALPSGLDLRETELRFLRVDAALVGGDPGTWSTVAAALDRGTLYLRDPLQPGAWTQVPTGIPANQTVLTFHQATPETAWVISRRNLITAPTLQEVHLASGAILRQQTLPDWTFVRVESLAAPRMGEAYFLLRRPAHLLPNLWKLDQDGLRPDLALPALVPPDRGALAVDGRMGKVYLVARAAPDRKASLWAHDLVTKTWNRLSASRI